MKKGINQIIAILLVGILAGCSVVAKVDARNDMEKSKTAYKDCLARNPETISACEGARLAYEADLKAYRATSAGMQSGRNDTLNINTDSHER